MSPFSHLRRLRPLTPAGDRVVAAIADLGTGSLNELAEASGHTRSQTGLALSLAEQRGWVREQGGRWRLTPAARHELEAPAADGETAAA